MKEFIFAAWLLGCGADAASTHYALSRGAREVIMTQNPWVNDAIIAGQATFGIWGTLKLRKRHPKWAVVVTLAMLAVRTGVTVHNMRQVR